MKTKLFLALLCLFLLSICLNCSSTQRTDRNIERREQARAHMRVGMAFLENLEYGNALRELQRAYNVIKDDPILLNSIGLAYKGMNDYDKALDYFNIALRVDPKFHNTYNNLGALYAERGDLERAKNSFTALIQMPTYETPELAHYNLAIIYIQQDDKENAKQELKLAIAKSPTFLHSYLQLGPLYRDTQHYDEAIDIFNRALKIQPDLPQFIYNIGRVYQLQDEKEKAIEKYREALNHPNCPEELSRNIRLKLIDLEGIDSLIL